METSDALYVGKKHINRHLHKDSHRHPPQNMQLLKLHGKDLRSLQTRKKLLKDKKVKLTNAFIQNEFTDIIVQKVLNPKPKSKNPIQY